MRIHEACVRPYRLALRRGWQSSRGRLGERAGSIIVLRAAGLTGYGDCAPLPGAGTETPGQARAWLARQLPRLHGKAPATALASLPAVDQCPPAARCGLETALIDLCAAGEDRPLADWLTPGAPRRVRANASIGVLNEHAARQVARALDQGFDVLKIKVGLSGVDDELRALNDIASALPPGVVLRLDANRAWSFASAERFLRGIAEMPVEAVEEPLADPDLDAWRALQSCASCPLAVDESLSSFDMQAWVERAGVRRILLKPMVVGGLLPALSLAKAGERLGVQSLVTTTVDSAAGVWAAVHLAAALPRGAELAHGLATSAWLAEDVADPPRTRDGVIRIGCAGGLGLRGMSAR